MPFLTQCKTNWKFVAIIMILAIIVGAGILSWIKTQEISPAEVPERVIPEEAEETGNLPDEVKNNENFIEWLARFNLKAEDFRYKSSSEFDYSGGDKLNLSEEVIKRIIEGSDPEVFYSLSPDKEKILEVAGGIQAIDTDVWLTFLEIGGRRRNVASCGTPCTFDTVFWLNDNEFIITGFRGVSCTVISPECPYIAEIFLHNLTAGTVSYYHSHEIEEEEAVKIEKILIGEHYTEEDITEEIIEWQTYSRKEYGFKINYPGNWFLGDGIDRKWIPPGRFINGITLNSPEREKMKGQDIGGVYREDITIMIEPMTYYGVATVEEVVEKEKYESFTPRREIVIDGRDAYEGIILGYGAGYAILVENNGYLYRIEFAKAITREDLSETEKQILSTFRFLE